MNPSEQVHDLEEQRDALLKAYQQVWEFVKDIGKEDPRSGGFIAERVRERMPNIYYNRRGAPRRIETGNPG